MISESEEKSAKAQGKRAAEDIFFLIRKWEGEGMLNEDIATFLFTTAKMLIDREGEK